MHGHRIAVAAVMTALLSAAFTDFAHAARGLGGPSFPTDGRNGGFGICKSTYFTATGKAWDKDKAKKRARRNWSVRVTFRYGAPYNKWDSASQRQYGCDKKGRWWHCSAFAYPCF